MWGTPTHNLSWSIFTKDNTRTLPGRENRVRTEMDMEQCPLTRVPLDHWADMYAAYQRQCDYALDAWVEHFPQQADYYIQALLEGYPKHLDRHLFETYLRKKSLSGSPLKFTEGFTVEFKAGFHPNIAEAVDTYVRTVCGFMNSEEGGYLLFGVNDSGFVTGITTSRKGVDGGKQWFDGAIRHHLLHTSGKCINAKIRVFEVELWTNSYVLIVYIPGLGTEDLVCTQNGEVYRRGNASNRKYMTGDYWVSKEHAERLVAEQCEKLVSVRNECEKLKNSNRDFAINLFLARKECEKLKKETKLNWVPKQEPHKLEKVHVIQINEFENQILCDLDRTKRFMESAKRSQWSLVNRPLLALVCGVQLMFTLKWIYGTGCYSL